MSPKSHNWKEIPHTVTSPHRALVMALREIRQCSSRTQAEIAEAAHQAASTLSNHLNGVRIPDESLLRAFYSVVEEEVAGKGCLPHSLNHLLELRTHALRRHCACCQTGFPSTSDEGREQKPPASPDARNQAGRRRALWRMRKARRRELSVLGKHDRVPVPLRKGDRHPSAGAELTWTETEVVAHFLASGRNRDAELLLWKAGAEYPAADILRAVTACRSAGLEEAAETILVNAAGRMNRQAVLNIAAALHHAGRPADVTLLLTAARD